MHLEGFRSMHHIQKKLRDFSTIAAPRYLQSIHGRKQKTGKGIKSFTQNFFFPISLNIHCSEFLVPHKKINHTAKLLIEVHCCGECSAKNSSKALLRHSIGYFMIFCFLSRNHTSSITEQEKTSDMYVLIQQF